MDDKELLKKYKPPVKGKEFKKYWVKLLPSVIGRDNFNDGHLKNLEILCSLYVDYDYLADRIKEEGFSYETEGRFGLQKKLNPEVGERKIVLAEIRQYSRLLDVVLKKDDSDKPDDDDNEWS